MTALENFVSPALVRALGWTLLHSLWQGALVAAVLAGALLLLRRQRAEVRYAASAGALGVVVALAGITFGLYFQAGARQRVMLTPVSFKSVKVTPAAEARPTLLATTPAPTAAKDAAVTTADGKAQPGNQTASILLAGEAPAARPTAPNWLAAGRRYFDNHMPLLVLAWLLGLLAMSLRMLVGLLYVQRLRRHRVRSLSQVWQERMAALATRSGLRRPVALLESALVRVPLVVGHVRPVILLPLGVVVGLSPAYLEAILAHELAHVLRRDYLVNLLQTVAEVLFFYHPAVWFVGNCVRTERENCCDDTATVLCGGDSLRLARALTALAEWSQSAVVPVAPRLALAAIGGRGALLNRVRRLVQRRPAAPTVAEGIMAGALVLGGLGLLGSSMALAGPLTLPAVPADKSAAFDWQGVSQSATVGDAGKQKSASSPGVKTETVTVLGDGEAQATDAAGLRVVLDEFGMNRLGLEDTTIRTRVIRRKPGRVRDNRRVIVDGSGSEPSAFGGSPGTVVITKDKKGRLTDLVVNGQRVETETGKRTSKGKGDEQRVEVIRMMPGDGLEARAFVYRNNGENRFEREFKREYEVRTRSFDKQFGPAVPGRNRVYDFNLNGNVNRAFTIVAPSGIAIAPAGSLRAQQEDLRAQREALRTAESALKEASAVKNLSPEQRKRLNQRLEEVRAQLRKTESAAASSRLRMGGADADRQQSDEMRARQQEMRERAEEMRERQQEMREEMEARRDEMRDRMQESDSERARVRNGSEESAIVAELLKDGLIKNRNTYQFKLSATSLVVDGKEQPKKMLEKYLKLYETKSGRKMSATGSMVLTRNSDSSTINDGPPPPRPPRAPRAPRVPRPATGFNAPEAPGAPGMPAMPAPPAPPTDVQLPQPPPAPRLDTNALRNEMQNDLRDELRKDGLIGQSDKGFQLQLNPSGLTVNGKRQPDELAAKYRKLAGHNDGQRHNLNISVQE